MALQFDDTTRTARAAAIETAAGASPILELRTGAPPATPATADSGTLLCSIPLPADFLAPGAAGVIAKNGTWSGTGGAGAGSGTAAGHFRIKNNAGTQCRMQGTVTGTGGGGDMTLDNVSIANGQAVSVATFQITEGNA